MKLLRATLVIALFLIAAAGCSDPASPTPPAPFASRDYDARVGGVQITRIYYDEEANQRAGGSLNEYVVLQGPDSFLMKNWVLDAGQGQLIRLSDTIFRTRTYYTREEPEVPNHFSSTFRFLISIWAEHDTAKLMNANNGVVSTLIY